MIRGDQSRCDQRYSLIREVIRSCGVLVCAAACDCIVLRALATMCVRYK
jgi:hypothetical protein